MKAPPPPPPPIMHAYIHVDVCVVYCTYGDIWLIRRHHDDGVSEPQCRETSSLASYQLTVRYFRNHGHDFMGGRHNHILRQRV